MRRFWIALGVLFTLLVVAVVGLNLWVRAYLRSEAFRKLVAAKTGEALHADADWQPLEWSGASVFSASLSARGESGAALELLEAGQVRASVNWRALFEGAWRVDRIDAVRLDLQLRTPPEQTANAAEPGPTPDVAPPKRGFLPNRFELERVSVQDANVTVDALGGIHHTALVATPEGKGWILDGSGGRLESAGHAPLDVENFRVRFQQGVVYLTDASLRLGPNGTLTVSGEVGGPDAPFDMQTQWQGVAATDVLDATWKKRLSGVLSGKARIVGRRGQSALTTGNFRLADGALEGLPVQKQIAHFTRSPQFERMPLQEVSGDFTTDGATTIVKNFVLESQGLLRVEGDCRIGARGELEGNFRVGVTSQSLQWLPGSQERVFITARNGYLWTTVRVGGMLENPTEDLSARLAQAVGEHAIDTGVQLLNAAPDRATDAVKKAADLLLPLIP
jgi:hypothetical protein